MLQETAEIDVVDNRPTYGKPEVKVYTEEDLKGRFPDVFLGGAFFLDTHKSPGL
jgi:hypothetical protein